MSLSPFPFQLQNFCVINFIVLFVPSSPEWSLGWREQKIKLLSIIPNFSEKSIIILTWKIKFVRSTKTNLSMQGFIIKFITLFTSSLSQTQNININLVIRLEKQRQRESFFRNIKKLFQFAFKEWNFKHCFVEINQFWGRAKSLRFT